jgi:hypothetical protein
VKFETYHGAMVMVRSTIDFEVFERKRTTTLRQNAKLRFSNYDPFNL